MFLNVKQNENPPDRSNQSKDIYSLKKNSTLRCVYKNQLLYRRKKTSETLD